MLRVPLHTAPAARGLSPGFGQYVGGRPIVNHLSVAELVMLRDLTRWAAAGCLHENRSALGAQINRDADWLDSVLAARAQYMSGGRG